MHSSAAVIQWHSWRTCVSMRAVSSPLAVLRGVAHLCTCSDSEEPQYLSGSDRATERECVALLCLLRCACVHVHVKSVHKSKEKRTLVQIGALTHSQWRKKSGSRLLEVELHHLSSSLPLSQSLSETQKTFLPLLSTPETCNALIHFHFTHLSLARVSCVSSSILRADCVRQTSLHWLRCISRRRMGFDCLTLWHTARSPAGPLMSVITTQSYRISFLGFSVWVPRAMPVESEGRKKSISK
jgi:hypothetical protein